MMRIEYKIKAGIVAFQILFACLFSVSLAVAQTIDSSADQETVRAYGREIVTKRTYYSKTYLNETDNTLTTVISAGYLHYRDVSGEMREIDRNIVLSSDNTHYQVTKGLYRAKFPFDITNSNLPVTFEMEDNTRFMSKLVALAYYDRTSKRLVELEKAKPSYGILKGNTIHYSEVFDGVDVEYEYKDTRLEQKVYLSQKARENLFDPESLGLKSNQLDLVLVSQFEAPDSLDAFSDKGMISLKEKGKKVRFEFEGKDAVGFFNNKGKQKFSLAKDFAFAPDSSGSEESVEIIMNRRFYSTEDENFILSGIPLNWLYKQPEGTVVLDPSVTLTPPPDDVWIENGSSSNYNSYDHFRVGKQTTYPFKRSLVKFNLTGSGIPTTATILSSQMQLYFYRKNGGTAVKRLVQCHQILQNWLEAQVTWYNRLTGTAWKTAGVGFNDIDAKVTPEDTLSWTEDFGWKTYNLTALTQKWVKGTATNYGVLLWATNEAAYSDRDEKWVYSSEYTGDTSLRPKLIITYTIDPLVTYTYDAFDRVTTATYGNGITETNTYDPNRDWITRRNYKNDTTNVFYFNNSQYDLIGNVKEQKYNHSTAGEDEEKMNYEYDNLDRLKTFKYEGSPVQTYTYDANGNFKTFGSKTFTYASKNNQVTNDGTRALGYDLAGRMNSIAGTVLTYDLFNNMKTHGTNAYSYDDANQRLKKTESGVTTCYITNGLNTLAEYNGSDVLLAEYIYDDRGMLIKYDPAKGYLFYYRDHLGSTRQMNSSSLLDLLRDYYPFGENYYAAGSESNYLFTGNRDANQHGTPLVVGC